MKKFLAAFALILCCTSSVMYGEMSEIAHGTCPLHSRKFKSAIVKVHYGFACPTDPVDSLKYPFSKPKVCGGCVVDSRKFARVKYCPTCQKVKESQMREASSSR